MNRFEEILCEGESLLHHNFHQNQQIYDKSTNQSNLISTTVEHLHSPFDSSPKASMFFFSLNSPRQNTDNFQFNSQNNHCRKNSKDHIQPIGRRLEFQEDASLFCQEQECEQQQASVKEEQPWIYESSDSPSKSKKIKKTKNSKGLKNLSIGVYEIVAEKSQTTYKQVANSLIEKLNKRAKEQMSVEEGQQMIRKVQKDEHNIKRRVYDALNVLISAELLRKQGKRVICNYNLRRQPGSRHYLSKQLQNTNQQLKLKKFILQQKKNQLNQLRKKYRQIKGLIQKNKKLCRQQCQTINLPFIVVKSNMEDVQAITIGDGDVEIQCKGNLLIMGDIDTIEELKLPTNFQS